jgi:hypothetical protein
VLKIYYGDPQMKVLKKAIAFHVRHFNGKIYYGDPQMKVLKKAIAFHVRHFNGRNNEGVDTARLIFLGDNNEVVNIIEFKTATAFRKSGQFCSHVDKHIIDTPSIEINLFNSQNKDTVFYKFVIQ